MNKKRMVICRNKERRNKVDASVILSIILFLALVAALIAGGKLIFDFFKGKRNKTDGISFVQNPERENEVPNVEKASLINIIDALAEIYEDDANN